MSYQKSLVASAIACSLLTGCAGPHFDITREIGLLPPRIEDQSDFFDDAKDRCEKYTPQGRTFGVDCIQYWEAVLWAQDYRSYVRARAILNRDVIYLGGLVALASVGALAGFSALGHTSSDAYKIIPIAGTFLGGFLAYSKNEILYDAYEVAGMKIDQTLRLAKDKVMSQTSGGYAEAAAMIRREVGAATDELTQKQIDIVKFQSKSEKDLFNESQLAILDRELGSTSLTQVAPNTTPDPISIKATLNEMPDPMKFPLSEFRLKLTDVVSSDTVETLRISSVNDKTLIADIPSSFSGHGEREFFVEVQARNGTYTLRGNKKLTLTFSDIRLDVEIVGNGTVTYPGSGSNPVTCSKLTPCRELRIKANVATVLSASNGASAYWKGSSCTGSQPATSCTVNSKTDTKVTVEFR